MKARQMGRFVGEFLEGLSGGKDTETEAVAPAAAPTVIPVDTVREAVTPMIRQIVIEMLQQAMAGTDDEDPAPSGAQLDLMFNDARGVPVDPLAEATVRRVADIRAAQEQKDREAAMGSEVPPMFDPNVPGDKPWMGANLNRETVERSTA